MMENVVSLQSGLILARAAGSSGVARVLHRGFVPLHVAACGGRLGIARLLLDRGADPKAKAKVSWPVTSGITDDTTSATATWAMPLPVAPSWPTGVCHAIRELMGLIRSWVQSSKDALRPHFHQRAAKWSSMS